MLRPTAVLTFCLFVCACDRSDPPESEESKRLTADTILLKDTAKAAPELAQRLGSRVSAKDGTLIIHPESTGEYDSYYLSANSPWLISCGEGLTITFGNLVSNAAMIFRSD